MKMDITEEDRRGVKDQKWIQRDKKTKERCDQERGWEGCRKNEMMKEV